MVNFITEFNIRSLTGAVNMHYYRRTNYVSGTHSRCKQFTSKAFRTRFM